MGRYYSKDNSFLFVFVLILCATLSFCSIPAYAQHDNPMDSSKFIKVLQNTTKHIGVDQLTTSLQQLQELYEVVLKNQKKALGQYADGFNTTHHHLHDDKKNAITDISSPSLVLEQQEEQEQQQNITCHNNISTNPIVVNLTQLHIHTSPDDMVEVDNNNNNKQQQTCNDNDEEDTIDIDFANLQLAIPTQNHTDYTLCRKIVNHLITNKFTITPTFLAQFSHDVHMIDIRNNQNDLIGPMGYIRGVNWYPIKIKNGKIQQQQQQQSSGDGGNAQQGNINNDGIQNIIKDFPSGSLLVIICNSDSDAHIVSRALRRTGNYPFTAPLQGGMRNWKLFGFSVLHSPKILESRYSPQSIIHHQADEIFDGNGDDGLLLTVDQLVDHIKHGDTLQSIKLNALLVHGKQSCIDGRQEDGIVATPGGDFGSFLILLSVSEELLNIQFNENETFIILQRLIETFGRFLFHTDLHAAERVLHDIEVEVDPNIINKTKHLSSDIILPTILQSNNNYFSATQFEDQILNILIRPTSLGCGHVKGMLTDGAKYKIRSILVEYALKAFHRLLFNGSPETDYVVLLGDHSEVGVVNIAVDNGNNNNNNNNNNNEKKITGWTKIPLITPTLGKNKQLFINHGQVGQYIRHLLCDWFLENNNDILSFNAIQATAFKPLVDLRAEYQAGLTVSKLAHNLPVYTLEFDQHHETCKVQFNGIVGQP